MPIQLTVFERRDSTERRTLGNAALAVCRAYRARDGIHSARYYWYGPETLVILIEGEAAALDLRAADPDALGAFFALADLAKMTINWHLAEPQAGEERYRLAGR